MIYFDNAATTLIKPQAVYDSMQKLLTTCANAGRSGHAYSMKSSQVIFQARESICKLLNFDNFENVIFTYNATYALNMAIKGIITEKCSVITSGFEHNSTIRPLNALENVNLTVVESELYNSEQFLKRFEESITHDTKYAVINHISNVFGYVLPLKEIDEICCNNNIKLIVDISQSVGIEKIDLKELKSVVAVCMPAHKGLYGFMGVGVLVIVSGISKSIIQGGTGSVSNNLYQPDFLPDMMESGTPNAPAIGSLCYGIDYVIKNKQIKNKTFELAKYTAKNLQKISNTKVFFCDDINLQSGVISFVNQNKDNEYVSEVLSNYGICTRAGFHCSPLAHKSANTNGTVRLSFSSFNNFYEVEKFIDIYKKI